MQVSFHSIFFLRLNVRGTFILRSLALLVWTIRRSPYISRSRDVNAKALSLHVAIGIRDCVSHSHWITCGEYLYIPGRGMRPCVTRDFIVVKGDVNGERDKLLVPWVISSVSRTCVPFLANFSRRASLKFRYHTRGETTPNGHAAHEANRACLPSFALLFWLEVPKLAVVSLEREYKCLKRNFANFMVSSSACVRRRQHWLLRFCSITLTLFNIKMLP